MMGGVLEDVLPVAERPRISATSVAADHRGMSVPDTAEFDAFVRARLPWLLKFRPGSHRARRGSRQQLFELP